ncbi:MAG TPA: hypothetical protein VID27_17875, partial [Blastocatellia bacterium]
METESPHDLKAFWQLMWPTEIVSLAIGLLMSIARPSAFIVAAPFLVLWAASPLIAFRVSRRLPEKKETLSQDERRLVRLISRRTWKFFETFVGADDNWLAPDNYQEDPKPMLAHRTSPTNIGLLLLSTAAARDMGYVGLLELIERLELTFATMDKLDRFHGHFLNWYDTRTLTPLVPQYISTVDSGNLAGHLLALKQGCIEMVELPLFDERVIAGLTDTISLMQEEAGKIGPVRQSTGAVTIKQLRREIESCAALMSKQSPDTLSGWFALIQSVAKGAVEIEDIINALSQEHAGGQFEQLSSWAHSLIHQAREHRRDLDTLAPWASFAPTMAQTITACSDEIAAGWNRIMGSLDSVPSLNQLPSICEEALEKFATLRLQIEQCSAAHREKALRNLDLLMNYIEAACEAALALAARYWEIAHRSDDTMEAMDFRVLFDE